MDQHSIDILRILVEHEDEHEDDLRYTEIAALVTKECGWKTKRGPMTSNSVRTTVSKLLKLLEFEYVHRDPKDHKNVRYGFKDEIAREKAKLIVRTSVAEWDKTMANFLKLNIAREGSLHEATELIVFMMPTAMLMCAFYRIIDAFVQNKSDDADFYEKQVMVTLQLYWGSFIKAVKKEQLRKQLREALDLADKNGETGLIPTNESELRELLDKKNQTMAARAAQERLGKW